MAKRVTCRCALYFNCARLPNTYVGMDARIVLAVIAILTLYKGKVRYVMADISRSIYSAGYVYSGKRHATVRRPSVRLYFCPSVCLSTCCDINVVNRAYDVWSSMGLIPPLGQLSLASLRGRLIEYQLRLG